jgi:WD40 repeat protein
MLTPSLVALALAAPPAGPPPARVDLAGDPLPPGAVLRLGTTRFRHGGHLPRLLYTPDGNSIVSYLGSLRIWDADSGVLRHEIKADEFRSESAAVSPDGRLIAGVTRVFPPGPVSGFHALLRFWDTATWREVRSIKVDRSDRFELRFTPDSKRLIMAAEGRVQVFDVATGDELLRQAVRNPSGGEVGFDLSPDGETVAVGRYELNLWDWKAAGEPRKIPVGGFGVQDLVFAPDGRELLACGHNRLIKVWEVATGRLRRTLRVEGAPRRLAFAPGGRLLAVAFHQTSTPGDAEGAVILLDPETGREVRRFAPGWEIPGDFAFSPDGRRLACAVEYSIRVFEVATGRAVGPGGDGHAGSPVRVAFLPGGRVATASIDATVRIWDRATGRPLHTLAHNGQVWGLAASPDGARVAGAGKDLRVWDVRTGRLIHKLLGNGGAGNRHLVRFSGDGRRLFSWGADLYFRTWDLTTGKLLAERRLWPNGLKLPDDEDDVRREMLVITLGPGDVTPDGARFVFAYGKRIYVFDASTGQELTSIEAGNSRVEVLVVSPDGSRVLVGGVGSSKETKLPGGGTRGETLRDAPVEVRELATGRKVFRATLADVWCGAAAFSSRRPAGRRRGHFRWRGACLGRGERHGSRRDPGLARFGPLPGVRPRGSAPARRPQ